MTTRKPKTRVEKLARRVNAVPREFVKQLQNGWEEALHRLPPEWRKVAKRRVAEIDHTRTAWIKRAERIGVTARKRAEKLAALAEKRVGEVVEPLSRRFDLPTRVEVDRLRKRVDQLERRMRTRIPVVAA